MKESSKKKIKWMIIAIVALILISVSALIVAILIQYNKIHVDTDFIEYESKYVIPPLPSDIVEISGPIEDDYDIIDPIDTEDPDLDESIPGNTQSGSTSKPKSGGSTNKDTNYIKDTPIYKVEPKDKDILNILLIGRDGGRSDSMIVASYNKKTGRIVLTSYMRDSLVYIQNKGWNRLNATFAYGGPGLTINTINQIFDMDIQYFVCIDFSGFTKVIDNMGGVTIEVTEAESQNLKKNGFDIPAGKTTLNGSQALMYSRIRKGVGDDYARTERQRKVITAALNKVFNEFSIPKALSFMKGSLDYVKTNLFIGDISSLLYDFMGRDNLNIDTFRVPSNGTFTNASYNGMSILKIDFDKNKKLIEEKIYK